jgi:hypothetical protein
MSPYLVHSTDQPILWPHTQLPQSPACCFLGRVEIHPGLPESPAPRWLGSLFMFLALPYYQGLAVLSYSSTPVPTWRLTARHQLPFADPSVSPDMLNLSDCQLSGPGLSGPRLYPASLQSVPCTQQALRGAGLSR